MSHKSRFSGWRRIVAFALFCSMTVWGVLAPVPFAMASNMGPVKDGAVYGAELAKQGSTASGTAAGSGSGASGGGAGFWMASDAISGFLKWLGINVDAQGFKKAIEIISKVISTINSILKLINDMFAEIFMALGSVIQGVIGGKRLEAEADKRMAIYSANSDLNDQMLYNNMNMAMDNAMPRTQHLCRKIVLDQYARSTIRSQEGVTRSIVDSMRFRQRGPNEDGAGPKGSIEATQVRCLNKYGNPLDGYPDSCVDRTTEVGPFKRKLTDADLLAATMDGAVTLEYPRREVLTETTQNGQTLLIARSVLENDNQRMWLAAVNYCFQMAGPRPTPPSGEYAKTPNGMILKALFDNASSRETAYAERCAKIIAYYTRLNPTDSPEELAADKKFCANSINGVPGKTNYIDEETMKEKFEDCARGLSPYQKDYLQALVCKTNQNFLLSASSGVLFPEMMDQAVQCGSNWNAWKLDMATRNGGLVDAVKGFMGVRKLWNKMLEPKTGRGKRSELDNAPSNLHPVKASPLQEAPAVLHRVSDQKLPLAKEDGLKLPMAVNQ
jgi:hypothetical protein